MRDFLNLLGMHRVEYLICGGHAVAFHGYPRLTMDLDILVRPSPENSVRIMNALHDFGFGNAGIPQDGFSKRGTAITLGVQPNQIDLLTSVGITDDDTIFERAVDGKLDGISVKYISVGDLVKAKREAGRPKDLADINELIKFSQECTQNAHESCRDGA
jgi:predicted nucleotidyltransferase